MPSVGMKLFGTAFDAQSNTFLTSVLLACFDMDLSSGTSSYTHLLLLMRYLPSPVENLRIGST
jgi:hypothetical protein